MIAQGAVTNEPAHYNTDLDSASAYRQRKRRHDRLVAEAKRISAEEWSVHGRNEMVEQAFSVIFCWGE